MLTSGKIVRLAALALLITLSGCGGLGLSHSVSPASFFLPGLIKADPKPAEPPDSPAPPIGATNLVAQVR